VTLIEGIIGSIIVGIVALIVAGIQNWLVNGSAFAGCQASDGNNRVRCAGRSGSLFHIAKSSSGRTSNAAGDHNL
jgi:hypothetical protein